MPCPMAPGVFGIARTRRARGPNPAVRRSVVIPAAMDRMSAPVLPSSARRAVSPFNTCGFTASTTAESKGNSSAAKAAWRWMARSARAAFTSSDGRGSTTWIAEKLLAAIQPLISAPPMRPAPIKRTAPLAGAVMAALVSRFRNSLHLYIAFQANFGTATLGLARAFQHGGRHGFLRRLAAPKDELEGGVIMLTGFNREVEQRLALGGADPRVGEDQHMAEEDCAVLRP